MNSVLGSYSRAEFEAEGTPRVALEPAAVQARFDAALVRANEELAEEGTVFYLHQLPREPVSECVDPERNILLGVRTAKGGEEPIDSIDLKGLDESTLKSLDALAGEIVQKVRQHLLARKTEGILFSASGTKFDTRMVPRDTLGIDAQGYLRIHSCRVLYGEKPPFLVIKAEIFHSYTVCRVIAERGCVRLFDDYDLVRRNCRGMVVQTSGRMWAPPRDLQEAFQEDARVYDEDYVHLTRDELTPQNKEAIIKKYRLFPGTP